MVGMAILSMLLGGIFWVYSSGANAWGKADDEIEALRQTHAVTTRLEKEIEHSIYSTLSRNDTPPAISFMSARDDKGQFTVQAGSLEWKKFVLVAYNATDKTLTWTERAITPPTTTASAIENYDFGSGKNPLSVCLTQPLGPNDNQKIVAKSISQCKFSGENRLLVSDIESVSDQRGRFNGGKFQVHSVVYFRNQ